MALVIGRIEPGFLDGHPENGTLVPLPPQHGGAVGWDGVYLSFGCDFADARLRVAVWNDASRTWRVSSIDLKSAGPRVNVAIQDGDSKVSVGRVKTGAGDTGTCPIGYLLETTLKA
ncbi:hypothetical protein [Kitasatospora cheerisanensis]|uniref:Uncharacterized protein n=1 Tax=Kitasatospora cheerisanensis KCTC 2395 TaxID=1348663 RepID=A0A066YZH1_9ACTN|nr:hypothetical protein [Kitasatospora cheerisanensis]KDN83486.1 hypothetical protein KCH_49680 [Kitasatospora cheerisanensis KCTC 2395]